MSYHSQSNIGRYRGMNQDRYVNYTSNRFSLHVVADGMGGHQGGEIAAQICVDTIRDFIVSHKEEEDFPKLLEGAIAEANEKIYCYSREHNACHDMGTTVVVCILKEHMLYYAHVGDSRIYLFTPQDGLRQITEDHSYVAELVKQGVLTKEEARYAEGKNRILRAVGIDIDVDADFGQTNLPEDGIVLLASDGLTNMVTDEEIASVLEGSGSLREKTDALIEKANENGGYDNITVTLIDRSEQ